MSHTDIDALRDAGHDAAADLLKAIREVEKVEAEPAEPPEPTLNQRMMTLINRGLEIEAERAAGVIR